MFPQASVDSVAVLMFDDVKEYCKMRCYSYNKKIKAGLLKAQLLVTDAVGPLVSLLEASITEQAVDPQAVQKAVSAASQRLAHERQRNVLMAMQLEHQTLVLSTLLVTGKDFFGDLFHLLLKDRAYTFKGLDQVLCTAQHGGAKKNFGCGASSNVPPSTSSQFSLHGQLFWQAPSERAGFLGRRGA